MHIRENFIPLVLAFKERAAFTDRLLLAALPAGPDAHQYVLVDKTTRARASAVGSSRARHTEAQHLWDAMWEHYAGSCVDR
jgi:hypothetical protein